MNDKMRSGSIRIAVAGDGRSDTTLEGAAGARVEILDRGLRLVRLTNSNAEINVAPGSYVVAVTLPDGIRHTEPVEVQAGETTAVELTWEVANAELVRARATARTGAKGFGPAPTSFELRFVEIRGDMEATPVSTPPTKEVDDDPGDWGGVLDVSISVHAPEGPPRVQFAEVSTGGTQVMIALPMANVGNAVSCRLVVALSNERTELEAQMLGSADAVTVAHFMSSGHIVDAAVPEAAEEMLYGKRAHPFGAALGGYALLRLKELDRLHDWPTNLAEWFDWLPDAHIILGEQQLRQGAVNDALESFGRAINVGLPVFTDGFSIASARLHALARGTARKDLSEDVRKEARQRLQTLSRWAPSIQFDALSTTLERSDGASVTKAVGWQRFRAPFGPPRDPRSFWSEVGG